MVLVGCTTQTSALDAFSTTRVKNIFRSDGRTHELQSSCAYNCHWPESTKQRFSNFKRPSDLVSSDGKNENSWKLRVWCFPQILRYDHLHCYLLHTHQFSALVYTTKWGENNLFLWYKRIKSSSSQLGVIVPL